MRRPATIHFFIALGFAVIALVGYVIAYVAFSSAREDALQAVIEVARIEEEDAAIAKAQDAIEALESDEAMLRSYFVEETDIVPFLEELERTGGTLESKVEVVSVTPATDPGGRLVLALRIEGSFASVMRTLGTIEYGPRDIRIQSVTLDTPRNDEGSVWTAAAIFSVATIEELP